MFNGPDLWPQPRQVIFKIQETIVIACIDVGYQKQSALAACVTISDWTVGVPLASHIVAIPSIEDYEPGAFYKRELPCIKAVLNQLAAMPSLIVVDGYVWLDADGKKGLGAHLFESLHGAVPVVGVAKTSFATATNAIEVYRGKKVRDRLDNSGWNQ